VTSALIDLDVVPADPARPVSGARRGRTALIVLSLLLIALLGPATPARPDELRSTMIPAGTDDYVFASGDRLYVVGAAPTGLPRPMRTYRLPDGRLLARTVLPVSEPVAAVRPVGATTLVATTIGRRPAVVAMDNASGLRRWWKFGELRSASATAGEVLLGDADETDDIEAFDLVSGAFRWRVAAPANGLLSTAGERDGLPQWLVASDPSGRLDSYDGRTGKHLASRSGAPAGPLAGPSEDLFVVGGARDGVTAYGLPALTVRWQLRAEVKLDGAWLGPDCGDVLCVFGPTLTGLDRATGTPRWTSDRWTYAQQEGDDLVVSDVDGAADSVPITVVDPATGRVRADLGGWRQVIGGGFTYLVAPGRPTLFGRFDWGRMAVRLAGTTDRRLRHCDAAAGAVVCHLTDGPVAIWQF